MTSQFCLDKFSIIYNIKITLKEPRTVLSPLEDMPSVGRSTLILEDLEKPTVISITLIIW